MNYLSYIAKNIIFKLSKTIIYSVKKGILFPLILSVMVAASGCNGSSDSGEVGYQSSDLASLQSAKTKWDSHSVQFYTIHRQRYCECVTEMSAQMKISVSGNSVLSAFDLDTDEVISKEIQEEIKTVESLFAFIKKAIENSVSIEVTYNEEYGYPETSRIDLEQLAVDGGLHLTLSNLKIKDSLLALDDVSWTLESFDSIAGPQPVIDNTNISLSIDMENKQFYGMGGCNNYSADFVLDDESHSMTISNIIGTEIACDHPENIMQQEQIYFATLENIKFFTFDKATLNMVVGGDAGLHFEASQTSAEEPQIVNPSNDLVSLQIAKTKWESYTGQYYTIQHQRFCECEDEMSAQMKISVLGNAVLSASNIVSGDVISKEIQEELLTVDSLFGLIEKAITNSVLIEVIYNEEYGYPETAKIDLEQLAVDGGLHITLSNLEIKDALLALDDVTWTLESFDSIAGPQPILENTNISLSIDLENRQLNGMGGCNNYSADFILDNESHNMTISNVISTERVCGEPENIMQQEQNFFTTLELIRFFTFDSATLKMVAGGDAGLHFVAVN
jgi:heat shock protein HslJ